uniref:Anamorsin homolog n=1 Tax=Araucaria cunninghamii TaxID=56994 RepID=A0A0D6R058_ARACU
MDSQPSALLVTDSLTLNAKVVTWALENLQVKAKYLQIISQAALLVGKLNLNSSSLDGIVSVSENLEFHSQPWLLELARVLKPGGKIFVQNIISSNQDASQIKVALERSFLLAGFVVSEEIDGLGPVTVKGQKPTWETGRSFSLKKKVAEKPGIVAKSAEPPSFKLDIEDDFDDLIDEDSLLTEEDMQKPELPQVDDCEVGKAGKKACKNCICGRVEMEEKQEKLQLTSDQLENPQSSCGSCSLGDAFRCASCPYKGLPPFKPGEKISLSGSFLTADV